MARTYTRTASSDLLVSFASDTSPYKTWQKENNHTWYKDDNKCYSLEAIPNIYMLYTYNFVISSPALAQHLGL